ncbi:hypothetical protein Bpfe_021816 [Biomphalaria pfeifferi]|uniref:Uncharacterized protein n=1 Tax=Biomphalaria pfeifferi TaxID=112525 RepID=A0AAD8F1W9_BIOPF|nr:hypothetical protein Bpfe_021816 [Biomphalaria pfeifferi]
MGKSSAKWMLLRYARPYLSNIVVDISHANTAREVRLGATSGNARFHMRILPEKTDLVLHLAMRDFTCEYCQRSPPWCYLWQCEI